MSNRLAGKVALVTGSTRGIGRSTAELFAAEGAAVAVTGRTAAKGQKVVDRIREAGGDAAFFELDVTDEESVMNVVTSTVNRFGSLSTLVNNVAPTTAVAQLAGKLLADYTNDDWNDVVMGTLTGSMFWTTKYAWPHLVKAEGAAIVNHSSGSSLQGMTGFAAYAASKGGMNSLNRVLAVEGAPLGIRSNCIVVGRVASGDTDANLQPQWARLPLGTPMAIAYVTLFLASDESSYVNGALLSADGGQQINGELSLTV
jgi:NAD(P)-dependent dehydrogenase (short-subunit alcohol dehydrogenase family)